ncbi:MAG: hypothetical protein LBC63_10060 [Holophagales bacterium]|jgi:hypothetical protein|nr:hypothetical protein [Holophagales bacterium]
MMPNEGPQGSVHQFLSTLKDAFARAEAMEARSSFLHRELDIIPINQLRYAGFHMLGAYSTDTGEWDVNELKSAINHCKHAYSDATCSVAEYLVKYCWCFADFYRGRREVLTVIPNYNNILIEMDEASRVLAVFLSRINEGKGDNEIDPYNQNQREEYMVTLTQHIETLDKTRRTFSVASVEIDALIAKNDALEAGKKRLNKVILVVTALSLVWAILSTLGVIPPIVYR